MKRILLAAAGAAALAIGFSVPAQAQSVTICVEAHVTVAGTAVVDQPQTCNTLPPAAP